MEKGWKEVQKLKKLLIDDFIAALKLGYEPVPECHFFYMGGPDNSFIRNQLPDIRPFFQSKAARASFRPGIEQMWSHIKDLSKRHNFPVELIAVIHIHDAYYVKMITDGEHLAPGPLIQPSKSPHRLEGVVCHIFTRLSQINTTYRYDRDEKGERIFDPVPDENIIVQGDKRFLLDNLWPRNA